MKCSGGVGWWERDEDRRSGGGSERVEDPPTIEASGGGDGDGDVNGSLESAVAQEVKASSNDEQDSAKAVESQPQANTAQNALEELKRDVALEDPLSSPGPLTTATSTNKEEGKGDKELREEIWKDVQRTHPGLHFFTEKTYAGLERILFVFAKLNPGVRYVQGMNEILAPIYYVIMCDKGSNGGGEEGDVASGEDIDTLEEQREADAFFCFCNLMGEIRELYIKELDDDSGSNGLKGRVNAFVRILQRCDPQLARRMEDLQLKPQYFAIRWLTTLLAREVSRYKQAKK